MLAVNPRDALSACDIGTTYRLLRKYVEAQRYFDLCISVRPDEEVGYRFSTRNYILWKADTKGAREILKKAPRKKSSAIVTHRFWVEFYDRRYQPALDVLSSPYADALEKRLHEGSVYRLRNKPELARASFNTARKQFEKELQEKPDDYDLHAALGIAYAGSGRKEDAIREGKRAVELLRFQRMPCGALT